MSDLGILCPSRGRPQLLERMVESALQNSTADILIYIDDDDEGYEGFIHRLPARVQVITGIPQGRGKAINHLCDRFRYRYYLVVSDDITFVRDDWEQEVFEAMAKFEDMGIVHLASENGERYANWVCASRKWIDTLGWFNYPACNWFCQDTILQCLSGALDRLVFIERQVVHHHIVHTSDVMERLQQDQHQFLWYMARHYLDDLERLRSAL